MEKPLYLIGKCVRFLNRFGISVKRKGFDTPCMRSCEKSSIGGPDAVIVRQRGHLQKDSRTPLASARSKNRLRVRHRRTIAPYPKSNLCRPCHDRWSLRHGELLQLDSYVGLFRRHHKGRQLPHIQLSADLAQRDGHVEGPRYRGQHLTLFPLSAGPILQRQPNSPGRLPTHMQRVIGERVQHPSGWLKADTLSTQGLSDLVHSQFHNHPILLPRQFLATRPDGLWGGQVREEVKNGHKRPIRKNRLDVRGPVEGDGRICLLAEIRQFYFIHRCRDRAR